MPRRLCIWSGIGVLAAGAGYLWVVRGTAILVDLSGAIMGMLCI